MLTTETKYYADEAMFHGFIARVMGTRFDLLLIGPGADFAATLWTQTAAELERLDRLLNRFDPAGETARINARAESESVGISDEMEAVLGLCRDYHARTEGLFDVTLGAFSRVAFPEPGCVRLGGAALDFGGFAKGYALGRIKTMLRRAGVRSAFVDFGNSSILALGRHPYGACWKVGLPDPFTGRTLAEFDLEDRALSTSGNTPRHTAHIVDPKTGIYDAGRKAAVVAAADPLDAEVLSTVRMIADERQWERIAANFENLQATLYTL